MKTGDKDYVRKKVKWRVGGGKLWIDYYIQEGQGICLWLNVVGKVKREVTERPQQGAVMLCNCVAFVLAQLRCDCSVSAPHESNTRAGVSFNLTRH